MTLNELLEALTDIAIDHDGDGDVLIATQPSWPMEYESASIGVTPGGTVYIGVGEQRGYLDDAGARAINWAPEGLS